MSTGDLGRELIQLTQIEQDFCNNTFGVAPCTAGNPLSYKFAFSGNGQINITPRITEDDFTLKVSIAISQTDNAASIITDTVDAGTNIIRIRQINDAVSPTIRLEVYAGLSLFFQKDAVLTDYVANSEVDIEFSRVGTQHTFAVTGVATQVFYNTALPLQFNKIGSAFKGYIYNLFLQDFGTGDGNTVTIDMPINDNSSTIKDYSASPSDGTLFAGSGLWTPIVTPNSKKCFNTYKQCQDKANFDRGTKLVTFTQNVAERFDFYTIPSLVSFSPTMPQLNIFSRDTSSYELGRYGKLTVQFQDLPFSDNHLDPYVSERDYNPLTQGTFWTKWLARNPYYNDWKVRIYDGVRGQDLEDMNVREYRIDKITNPNSKGGVTLTATDLLRRIDKNKAMYPPVSACYLRDAIGANATVFYTVGKLTEYTLPGTEIKRIKIADNYYDFLTETDEGGGEYKYTVIPRTLTPQVAHGAGEAVENALFIESSSLYECLYALLIDYYTTDDFDWSGAATEISTYLPEYSSLSTIIKAPTAINELVGQLAAECGFYIWYDEDLKKIKLKAVRDEISSVQTYNQYENLIQNQTSSSVITESRASNSLIYYFPIDYFGAFEIDYLYRLLTVDEEAASINEYGETTTYEMKTRWLVNSAQAASTGARVLTMFRDNYRLVSFQMDIKDDIKMAQVFKLAYQGFTDEYGNEQLINWICIGRTRVGDIVKIIAQEFMFNVPDEV